MKFHEGDIVTVRIVGGDDSAWNGVRLRVTTATETAVSCFAIDARPDLGIAELGAKTEDERRARRRAWQTTEMTWPINMIRLVEAAPE